MHSPLDGPIGTNEVQKVTRENVLINSPSARLLPESLGSWDQFWLFQQLPESLVSTYDPFLATVKQAHATHTRLWTCTAKLEQLGRYLQLKYQQLLSKSQDIILLP